MVRVLFVDDDPLMREAMYRSLRWHRPDWEVALAEDFNSALAVFDEQRIDAAVLDLQLPGRSGLSIAQQARHRNPDLVCFMLTAHGSLETAMASINDAGVAGFFQKPCPAEKIAQSVESSLAARRRGRELADIGGAALEGVHAGAFLVDGSLALRHFNRRAEMMLRAGYFTVGSGGTLRGATPSQTRKLQAAVQQAGHSRRSIAMSLASEQNGAALTVAVRPLDQDGQAVIFVRDPREGEATEPGVLQAMFDLSPAEARLTAELAGGATVEEAAGTLGISLASARTYLKNVFLKTDVNRQVDLVRLVLGSAAVFANGDGEA